MVGRRGEGVPVYILYTRTRLDNDIVRRPQSYDVYITTAFENVTQRATAH